MPPELEKTSMTPPGGRPLTSRRRRRPGPLFAHANPGRGSSGSSAPLPRTTRHTGRDRWRRTSRRRDRLPRSYGRISIVRCGGRAMAAALLPSRHTRYGAQSRANYRNRSSRWRRALASDCWSSSDSGESGGGLVGGVADPCSIRREAAVLTSAPARRRGCRSKVRAVRRRQRRSSSAFALVAGLIAAGGPLRPLRRLSGACGA